MTFRPTTNLSDAPDPGQAYRRIWGDLGAEDPGDQTTPQDTQPDSDMTEAKHAPQLQLAGSSPLDSITRTGVRTYFQANPEAKRNVRDNLRGVVGAGFSDGEMGHIADQFLDNAGFADIGVLHGITAGAPQTLTTRQKTTIDGIVARLPNTPINQRAIAAYKRALANGSIRVR